MRGNRDLQLAVRIAVISALLAILLPVPVLSLIVAAPLIFFLPGYAIVCAAFARREVDVPRLLVLSFGLSLAVLALVPILLDALPGGISTGWWAVGLCLVVLAAARRAALRRPKPVRAVPRPRIKVPAPERVLIAVGVLAGVIAMFVAFHPVSAERAVGYTELWIEPLEQATPAARVGVASREQQVDRFTIEMRTGGSERPFETRIFRLAPGDEEEFAVRPPSSSPQPVKLSVTLFRTGIAKPYRRVAAWVPEAPE